VDGLIDELRARQGAANETLAGAIEHARSSNLRERLAALTAEAQPA
jgi:hypothetical protein